MRRVTIEKQLPVSAEQAYKTISDFKQFEKHCAAVISIGVNKISDTQSDSTWKVHFHDGEMCWREKDIFNNQELTIDFNQLEGDAEEFYGRWIVETVSSNRAKVCFEASFCMGIPTLADILEPIAETAITNNINNMLTELFITETEGEPA
ncbi:type II toxin-antitoxin system RatA family toxin [Pseudoalteromonas citrea]|nr:SRPBCC family protein [Pseudoalteromonas citrea]